MFIMARLSFIILLASAYCVNGYIMNARYHTDNCGYLNYGGYYYPNEPITADMDGPITADMDGPITAIIDIADGDYDPCVGGGYSSLGAAQILPGPQPWPCGGYRLPNPGPTHLASAAPTQPAGTVPSQSANRLPPRPVNGVPRQSAIEPIPPNDDGLPEPSDTDLDGLPDDGVPQPDDADPAESTDADPAAPTMRGWRRWNSNQPRQNQYFRNSNKQKSWRSTNHPGYLVQDDDPLSKSYRNQPRRQSGQRNSYKSYRNQPRKNYGPSKRYESSPNYPERNYDY